MFVFFFSLQLERTERETLKLAAQLREADTLTESAHCIRRIHDFCE